MSIKLLGVEGRTVWNTQTTKAGDEDVASSGSYSVGLEVANFESPESSLARESSRFDSGSENDVIQVHLFLDTVEI